MLQAEFGRTGPAYSIRRNEIVAGRSDGRRRLAGQTLEVVVELILGVGMDLASQDLGGCRLRAGDRQEPRKARESETRRRRFAAPAHGNGSAPIRAGCGNGSSSLRRVIGGA